MKRNDIITILDNPMVNKQAILELLHYVKSAELTLYDESSNVQCLHLSKIQLLSIFYIMNLGFFEDQNAFKMHSDKTIANILNSYSKYARENFKLVDLSATEK